MAKATTTTQLELAALKSANYTDKKIATLAKNTADAIEKIPSGKSAYQYAQEGGYSGTEAEFSAILANAVDKRNITLGLHTDGLIYLFIDDAPVGNGIALPSGGVNGDVVGNVDSANNIVLMGNLADGTYTVKYEMEDGSTIDIGNLVLNDTVYYSVTNHLTNCTNGNTTTQLAFGDEYIGFINVEEGYELKSIVVTMDGFDITDEVVADNVINIASVTGNIVITAVAEEKAVEVEPTNFCVVDTSVNSAPNPSNPAVGYANTDANSPSYGWISGGRCSSAGADRTDSATTCVTNYIPVQNGDILYVKNLDISTNVYSGIYKSDYSAIAGFFINESATHVKDVDLSGEWEQFTINNANAGFIRITGAPSIFKDTNGSGFWGKYDVTQLNIIVNIKRNGEWL